MGYKGFLRSVGSVVRQIERDSRRWQREYERYSKQQAKLEALEQAKLEVDEYENYIELIQSMHKDCNEIINWDKVKNAAEPKKPIIVNENEIKATEKYNRYKPNFIDIIFKLSEKKKNKLFQEIELGKLVDKKINEKNLNDHQLKYDEWKKTVEIAGKILMGYTETYMDVMKEMSPFEELEYVGSSLDFNVVNKNLIEISLNVLEEKVVPKQMKSLLSSGKLSLKDMPIGKFNEIYQDYVCSAILRIARETFALLPIEKIMINAFSNRLNTTTGNKEDMTILSVFIPKKTFSLINFENIDPSDCMKNFICNMNFKKPAGLNPVEKLDYKKYE